jgi:amino-acid N-acetyltransferase
MHDETIKEHVELIREVFVYAHRFKGRTFVFQIDFAIVDHPFFPGLVKDLVMLKQLGIDIVIVPGARQHIDEILKRYDIQWEMHGETRIAPPEATPFIKMAAFDAANKLMTLLTGHGVSAVIGNWVRARAVGVRDGVDYHDAGTVDRIKRSLLLQVIQEGSIPIFPCIGWSVTGKPYNISSRELATTISVELQAAKLFFVSTGATPNRRDFELPDELEMDAEGRISRMTVAQTEEFLERNTGSSRPDGERPADSGPEESRPEGHAARRSRDDVLELIRRGHHAAQRGVDRVHVVDGRLEGVILKEIFSNLGVGTMIHANTYQSIRAMTPEDVADVYRVMQPWVNRGVLVPRSEETLSETYPDYVVYDTDGSVHGCGALHRYSQAVGEIAGVATDEKYEQLGIGRKIVLFLMDRARRLGLKRVLVLTTQTTDWFLSIGFRQGSVSEIPEERRKRYDPERASRVLIHDFDENTTPVDETRR